MKIDLEYRKGIMFLRLNGSLNIRTLHKLEDKINEVILENNFFNIVINLDNLKNIDTKGISLLYHIYEVIKKYKGIVLICIDKNEKVKQVLKREKIFDYIYNINSELNAFELIKI